MGAFDTLGIASSSLGMHQTWLDALANNIANVNTAVSPDQDAFQGQMVVATARPGGGVDVAGIVETDPEGTLVHNPGHPLADEQGYVRMPGVDMTTQMTELVMAQRGYQAAAKVAQSAQDGYSTALQIGRS